MNKRNPVYFIFTTLVILILLASTSMAFASGITAGVDVTVCHATASQINPYTKNVVSVKSVDDANGLNGHGDHLNDAWEPYVFLDITYPGRNTDLFGSIIDADCNTILPTATPTEVPPTATPTEVPPTATPTEIPPTSTPTGTPVSPTSTPIDPTVTPTKSDPTTTPTEVEPTMTPTQPTLEPTATNTPMPPVPGVGGNNQAYPGILLGSLKVDGRSFELYQGVNAEDGTLLLPSAVRGGALYNNGIWIHRAWNSGWLVLNLGSNVEVTLVDGTVFNYTVTEIAIQGYNIYPKTDKLYIASCFSNGNGNWIGVLVYTLEK